MEVEESGKSTTITTAAFFQLGRYKFFSPPDCFASDLANIMRVGPVTDQFSMHALHAWPGSPVPFLALAVWNEDLRREVGANCPMDFSHDPHWVEACRRELEEVMESVVVTPATTSGPAAANLAVTPAIRACYQGRQDIPAGVGTITKDVRTYDPSQLVVENGELLLSISDEAGEVERVLTDHVALLSFTRNHQQHRVLASWDDIFPLEVGVKQFSNQQQFIQGNTVRKQSGQQLWRLSARSRQLSLKVL